MEANNDIQALLHEVKDFFERAARDMRSYTSHEVQAAIMKIAEYLIALLQELERVIFTNHAIYVQRHDEVLATELSPALLEIGKR